MLDNLFAAIPTDTTREAFDDLLAVPGLRIERIVSHGQKSPPNFWYKQDEDEWVIVLQGCATLRIEGHDAAVTLAAGDHYWLLSVLHMTIRWLDDPVGTLNRTDQWGARSSK